MKEHEYSLVCIRNLVLYGAFVVNASAVGTFALLAVGFDIVIAELANLDNIR